MVAESKIFFDMEQGKYYTFIPQWLDTLIYIAKSDISHSYYTELKYNPSFISHSARVHRRLRDIEHDIVAGYLVGEITEEDYKRHLPGRVDRHFIRYTL